MEMLFTWMVKTAKGFVVKNKGIFMKAIIAYANTLPENTKENTCKPNTHRLIDAWDKVLGYYDCPQRNELMRAISKIHINEYEHDLHYASIMDFGIEELVNNDWGTRPCGHPNEFWNEPEPYGGGYLIKDETLKQPIFKRRLRILEEE